MPSGDQWWWWIFLWLGYELVRWRVVGAARRWLQDGALRFVRTHRVRVDAVRFMDRLWLREALMADPEVEAAAAAAARDRGVPIRQVLRKIEGWTQEMAPAFSLPSYYRLGATLARNAVRLAYELVFDPERQRGGLGALPKDAIVIYVMNHRSNADYVVLSYALLRQVALSYAVGEWARVWPLDILFRSFGSFFIRRGEKDRLYHVVLARFVQLLVGAGGTTGFFIEGGLSRDGALRPPKAGLLDYLVGIRRHQPERELVFVPIGLNYDRVIEDRTLLGEVEGSAPPGLLQKLRSLVGVLLRLPLLIGGNLLGLLVGAHRKLGYAAVAMGAPMRLTEWPGGTELASLPEDQRREQVKRLATELLRRVSEVVPATPVPIVCVALSRLGGSTVGRGELLRAVRDVLGELRSRGAPIALGRAFLPTLAASSNVEGVDDDIEALGEAEQVVGLGVANLLRRGILRKEGPSYRVREEDRRVVGYYAASLAQYLEG